MKRFLCLIFFAAHLSAQTIDPNQIRPGGNGQVIGTVGGNTQWTVPSSANQFSPGTASASIARTANENIASNSTALYSDGTQAYSAGPIYASFGTFIDDFMFAAMHNPTAVPAANVLSIVNRFIANANGNGDFPIAVPISGAPFYFSAWDQHQTHVTGDGWIMVPQGLYLYCQDVGITSSACINAYNADIAAIKVALSRPPRNATTGLITVNAGDEYVPGTAFMEYMRFTGDVANANVFYAIVCQKMAALATAAGDTTNITFFNSQYANTVNGIQANLIDGTTGMLRAATGQNSSNLDVVSSVLADYYGLLTTAQNTAIENYINANYSTLVNADGYILETPGGWSVIGHIPASGGPPYTAAGFTSTQYQGGYWTFFFAEFAATLAKTNTNPAVPGKVASLLQAYISGADPNTEYYNVGNVQPQGTSPNLESPDGPLFTAQNYPLLVSTQFVQFPYQAVLNGGPNNLIENWTSDSVNNTANYLTNTSGNGYQVADLLVGSAGIVPGERCVQIIKNNGVVDNYVPFCLFEMGGTQGGIRLPSAGQIQWTNINSAGGFSVDSGISRAPTGGGISVDQVAGDNKGTIAAGITLINELGFKGTTFTISGSGTTPIGAATAGTFVCPTAGSCVTTVTMGAGIPSPTHGWLTLEVRDDSVPSNVCLSTARSLTVTFTCTTTTANEVIEFALAGY